MSILDRQALEQSPLADLHAIASELSIDSFRRLRKAELIEAILVRQAGDEPAERGGEPAEREEEPTGRGGEPTGPEDEPPAGEDGPARRRRWRRGARGRGGEGGEGGDSGEGSDEPGEATDPVPERSTGSSPEVEEAEQAESPGPGSSRAEPDVVDGVVELLPGGSGFVRVNPPGPSDDDVYVSSAQVKRCELVTGDRVSGPRRAPRRSERFASLVRVDTVNGRPASELSDSVRFEERPVAFPDQRLTLPGDDPTLEAIARLAPIGRGSRVTISGGAASGKTETLRRLAHALAADESIQVWLALTGVRPEELAEWQQGPVTPAVSLSFAASSDVQSQSLEGVVEQVRRLVARGADAVILIDTLDGVGPYVARKVMASARNVVDGGSLTVIATTSAPLGGETTVLALAAGGGESPSIDESRSWTIRRERLG